MITEDLSAIHQPLGNSFPQPGDAQARNRYRLTADQLDFYEMNGYVAGIRLLDDVPPEQIFS